jgi:hypothetical protein
LNSTVNERRCRARFCSTFSMMDILSRDKPLILDVRQNGSGPVLAGIGAAAVLIGLLGIRFNRVKVGGAELGYERATEGLAQAEPAGEEKVDAPPIAPPRQYQPSELPVKVELRERLGEQLGSVPVAITQLARPMSEVDPTFLRDYQSARKVSQRAHFLTHILGPATQPGQKYSVAIRVSRHKDATSEVKSASFYLGRAWGNRVFRAKPGPDGRFGIATEAYGPFLALCEVEFQDGSRILLDHYCDFDMGALLTA